MLFCLKKITKYLIYTSFLNFFTFQILQDMAYKFALVLYCWQYKIEDLKILFKDKGLGQNLIKLVQ